LTYDLEMGKTEQTILDQARTNNMPVPDKIKNAPTLQSGLEFYYTAFIELSTCRDAGMGAGPIPWESIHKMGTDHLDLDEEDFDRFVQIIRGMDLTYLDYQESKGKENANKTHQSTSKGQRTGKTKSRK